MQRAFVSIIPPSDEQSLTIRIDVTHDDLPQEYRDLASLLLPNNLKRWGYYYYDELMRWGGKSQTAISSQLFNEACLLHDALHFVYVDFKTRVKQFTADFSDNNQTLLVTSMFYTLPIHPAFQLIFLQCINAYLNCLKEILFYKIYHPLDYGLNLFSALTNEQFELMNQAIESKQLFEAGELALPLLNEKILIFSKGINDLHYHNYFYDLIMSHDSPRYTKLSAILKRVKTFIADNQKLELKIVLKHFELSAKRKLFSLCLGKQYASYCNEIEKFTWTDRIWFFLRDVDMMLRADGRISIPKTEKNLQVYDKYYTSEFYCGNASGEFRTNLSDFALACDLKFEKEMQINKIDQFQEVVFSEESSEKLINLGLHLNEQYIKNMLYLQNNSLLFFRGLTKNFPHELSMIVAMSFKPTLI